MQVYTVGSGRIFTRNVKDLKSAEVNIKAFSIKMILLFPNV